LNLAAAYFGAEKYSLALKWNNKLLNDVSIDESQDLHCYGQILSLIIHIELKHDDFIPHAFKSTHRYLSSRNRVYKFENVFLDFVGKILKTKSREEQTKYYKELKAELEPLEKDPFEKTVFENFDFVSWVDSKIKRIPFREIVEEKVSR
jgi:hypothetical protein